MAAKNTDAQRGPLGAWAYHVRDLLGASPEDAAAAAGISPATLRKIEGGSNKAPAKRTVFDLWQHYRKLEPVADPDEPVGVLGVVEPDRDAIVVVPLILEPGCQASRELREPVASRLFQLGWRNVQQAAEERAPELRERVRAGAGNRNQPVGRHDSGRAPGQRVP